ncbi:replication protein [Escherichia coli]
MPYPAENTISHYCDNVTPIRPALQAVECHVADLDDGYVRLSNMLLEAYSGADLTKRHFKVLLAILRKTYGWNKPMDRITDAQLSEITKLPVKRCNEAKLELVRMNILRQQGGMYGPNANISEWGIPQEGTSPKTGDKTSLKMREHKRHKDNKDIKTLTHPKPFPSGRDFCGDGKFNPADVELPDWIEPSLWVSWVDYRQNIRKPIKSPQTVTQALRLLDRARQIGYWPEEIINRSIANGWQGLFIPNESRREPEQRRSCVNMISEPDTAIPTGFRG